MSSVGLSCSTALELTLTERIVGRAAMVIAYTCFSGADNFKRHCCSATRISVSDLRVPACWEHVMAPFCHIDCYASHCALGALLDVSLYILVSVWASTSLHMHNWWLVHSVEACSTCITSCHWSSCINPCKGVSALPCIRTCMWWSTCASARTSRSIILWFAPSVSIVIGAPANLARGARPLLLLISDTASTLGRSEASVLLLHAVQHEDMPM